MKLKINRTFKGPKYTIGHLYINDIYFCDTIEDIDRGLNQKMSSLDIRKIKVPSLTAIPTGTYKITLNIVSPKFNSKAYYHNFCRGKLPRLLDVPGFEGILIHRGRTEKHSSGCIIVGKNTIKGQVTNSQHYFELLYKELEKANNNKEEITIEII